MTELDLQVLKEAREVLNDYEGEYIEGAKTALSKIINIWDTNEDLDTDTRAGDGLREES